MLFYEIKISMQTMFKSKNSIKSCKKLFKTNLKKKKLVENYFENTFESSLDMW